MMRIEIKSTEWEIEEMTKSYMEDASITAAQARACADTEYAWLINNTGTKMSGWSFTGGVFSGQIRNDALSQIMSLLVEASDYVLEHLDEVFELAE